MTTETAAPTLDALLATLGWKANLAGAITSTLAWLLSSQGAALIGMVGVIGGLTMQWYFKRREDRRQDRQDQREQEEHEMRMRGDSP